jgi:hypothetical protein
MTMENGVVKMRPAATITACADFVGTLGRKGARLFARMV